MKAIGIDAIVLDDNLEVVKKESTLIQALLDNNGDISYQEVLEVNTLKEIQNYDNLSEFLETTLNAAKQVFGTDFNAFEISGVDDEDNYLWNIRCIIDEDYFFYNFKDLTEQKIKFVETLVKQED